MLRLGLAARITTIVLVSLAAVWIVTVALHVRGESGQNGSGWPEPKQIAAIATLIERSSGTERDLALDAVTSRLVRARLEGGNGNNEMAANAKPADAKRVAPYTAALGGRPVTVLESGSPIRSLPLRVLSGSTGALQFRIQLRDNARLVIDTRGPLAISRFGFPVGFGAGLFGTLVALIALIVLHRETKPLARLVAAVDQLDLTRDPVSLSVARASAPEIQALVAAFNRLQDRLKTLLLARMAMLGGISHDVRTFATRLRLRTERIPDEAERELANRDIADMIRLLDDALLTSRAGAGELEQELVEFDDIVRREVEERRALGARVDMPVAVPKALVLGDRVALRRIVSNLVENAITYGHAAHVRIAVTPTVVELIVDDEGPGLPEALRATMLEPFTRAEGSRNRRTGGAGLGLAIVQSLVEAQGGRVSIGQAPNEGARFCVYLPFLDVQGRGK